MSSLIESALAHQDQKYRRSLLIFKKFGVKSQMYSILQNTFVQQKNKVIDLININSNQYAYQLHSQQILKDVLFSSLINTQTKNIVFKTEYSRNLQILNCHSKTLRNSLLKILWKINLNSRVQGFNYIINPLTGVIYLKICMFYALIQDKGTSHLDFIMKRIVSNALKLLKDTDNIQKILKNINETEEKSNETYQQHSILQRIRKHLLISQTEIQKSSKLTYLQVKTNKFEQQLKEKIIKFQNIQQNILRVDLYYYHNHKIINLEIQQTQYKDIQDFLKVPVPKDNLKSAENKFLFNFITVQNTNKILVLDKCYKEGGFSKIALVKLIFQYTSTNTQPKTIPKKSTPIFKILAVKIPKNEQGNIQLENQKKIVNLFRSAVSAFFLKYYCCRQQSFPFKDALLMDASKSKTLIQYISANNQSISIRTKLFFMIQIAQALRHLSQYQIVHMDLKPANILVNLNQHLIKLIDFSQSYNQKVCGKDYSPGYTMPYAPPQIFDPSCKQFNQKQDVFSFGILLFRIIFQHSPFNEPLKLIESYINKTYLRKVYLSAQFTHFVQNYRISYLILNLILRCVNPNPNNRPKLAWIVIILKQIFIYVLNQ